MEQVIKFLKLVKEILDNYESDEDFMLRIMRENEKHFS